MNKNKNEKHLGRLKLKQNFVKDFKKNSYFIRNKKLFKFFLKYL